MATKIPYIIPPKVEFVQVGDDSIGAVAIQKHGELTPQELDYIDLHSQHILTTQDIAIATASEIAEKLGCSILDTANNLLFNNYDFFKGNLDIVLSFNKKITKANRSRRPILASAIIKYRISTDWEIEDAGNSDEITPALLNAIADFAIKERDGWEKESEEPEQDVAESQSTEISATFDDVAEAEGNVEIV